MILVDISSLKQNVSLLPLDRAALLSLYQVRHWFSSTIGTMADLRQESLAISLLSI